MYKDIFKMRAPYRLIQMQVFFLALSLLSVSALQAQSITETRWYFGNSAENFVFDPDGRDVILQTDQAVPFGTGGSATIVDQFTGNLLFYSDGSTVYDVSHSVALNGNGLSGNPTINTPIVVSPVVGNPGQYYLFTNSGSAGVNEIQYSIVDANAIGNGTMQFPYGQVTSLNNGTGLNSPSEGMLIIPQGNGNLFWLISQNSTDFQIRVTRVDGSGVGATTTYDFTDGTTPGFEASHFAFNADSSKLVMAPKRANRNIWMMDFDSDTGVPSFDRQLLSTGFDDDASESIYDLEWSADGSKLYFSRFGGSGITAQLYQLDFNDSTESVNPILPAPIFRSFGLQRAPDDRIYHLYQNAAGDPLNLGRINRPDSTIDSLQYQPIVFPEDFNGRQFPAFTAGYNFSFDTLGFYWIDSCLTNITKFFPVVEPVPNSIRWLFGDSEESENWIANHEYQNAQAYTVRLIAEVAGITDTIPLVVDILQSDLMVDLGNDTTICVDEVLPLDAGEGASFVWSTGEFTQTIEVDTAGTYWVEVTNTDGCTSFDDIEVTEYGVANQVSNQWYFGEQAGIEFTNGPIAILDGNQQSAPEGCATVSDVNGDLLFYTNGSTIWNRDHDVMLNGDSIGGKLTSAQNSIIMPYGDDETMFYVFTTENVYGDDDYALRYSVVDMKGDTARGQVVIKNIKLMDHSSERITGSGFTGNDLIVAHEFGNNTFRAYATGPDGLSSPIFSPVGAIHEFMNEESANGYMKISPTLEEIAVNIPGTNQVEILDFDQGAVSNPRLIDTGETDLYGLEFSPGGTKLYLTTSSANSKLIQYDLDSLDSNDPETDISATKYDGYAQGSDYGALQTGPNGIIYMAIDNSGSVGTINSPEGDDEGAGFSDQGFDLAGRTSRRGLPNFAQVETPPLQEPSMTVTDGCTGQESSFSAVGRDPNNQIENYLWIFGDGTSAVAQDTTHIYTAPGTYTVQLVLSNRCDTDTTLRQTITINNIPESPTVPTDSALCDQPIVLTAWPEDNPDFSYYWSTGDSTRQITVSERALIDVAIINTVTGCTSDTVQIFVGDARSDVDLGPDRTICQNDEVGSLDALIPRATYAWYVDGVLASETNRTFPIDSTRVGVSEYSVEVTNRFGCIGRDTIFIDIQPEPDITVATTSPPDCNSTGSMDITFNSSGSFSYQLAGPTPFGPSNFDGVATAPSITGLEPGNYTLLVTNLVTGCTNTEVVQLEDPVSFNFSVANVGGNCDGEVILELSSVPANFSYSIEDQSGVVQFSGSDSRTNFSPLDPGTYFVEVTDLDAPFCTETEQITIAAGNEPDFSFDAIQEICGTSGEVSVMDGGTTPGVLYSWSTTDSNGSIVTSPAEGETVQVTGTGSVEFTVTATTTTAGFCTRVEVITVNFNDNPEVIVTSDGEACDGAITLTAEVSNASESIFYTWSDGGQSSSNVITTSGSYTVTVVDQLTGCEVTSDPIDVEVYPEFNVSLALSPDCDGGSNVFLAAIPNYYDPGIAYEWRDAQGNRLADSDSILTINTAGTYTAVVTNEQGTCVVTESQTVEIVPILPSDLLLPETASFCTTNSDNPAVDLDPGIFNSYEWRLLPDETIISTDPVLSVTTPGTYEVTLYNGFTCTTDQVVVTEGCRPTIVAPNAFSPNNNGVNDEFFVFPNEYVETFIILIYNRWGELIYTSDNKDFRWDGTSRNGSLAPPGSYAYVMKFSSSQAPELGTIEQYGSITLIR